MPLSEVSGAAMRRREFITLISGVAAWPLAARAQQTAIPIVGFLRPTRAEDAGSLIAAFRQGLRKSGYPSDKVAINSPLRRRAIGATAKTGRRACRS